MDTLDLTKERIQEKIGKKWWLDDQKLLAAKLDYKSGIDTFDQLLGGKSLKEFDAVIHLEKFPKGLLIKIVKGFGLKTFPFPLSNNEIKKVRLTQIQGTHSKLVFELTENKRIEFKINRKHVDEVKEFLEEIKLEFDTEIINKPIKSEDIKPENTKKHGVPTIISFFVPGVGQIIKGHMMKAAGIWIIGGVVGFFLWWTIIAPFIVWVWNVYDAYNSNSDWKFDKNKDDE